MFKKKSKDHRTRIRTVLKCIRRVKTTKPPKDLWKLILNKIQDNNKGSGDVGQIVDLPHHTMDQETFLHMLHVTLTTDSIFKRNPLLYSDNATILRQGTTIHYGKNSWLCYPSVCVQAFPVAPPLNQGSLVALPTEQVFKIEKSGDIFLGVFFSKGVWPKECWIDGTHVTETRTLILYPDYRSSSHQTHGANLLYFPQLGPKVFQGSFNMRFPKNTTVSFNSAFCVCSHSVKQLFTNKKHKRF